MDDVFKQVMVGVLIAASSFLGLFASYISVKQYLVKIEPK